MQIDIRRDNEKIFEGLHTPPIILYIEGSESLSHILVVLKNVK